MSDTQQRYSNRTARVGDKIELREPGYSPIVMTVSRVLAPGTGGISFAAGPVVSAHVRPGGYGITFDAESFHAPHVYPAPPADRDPNAGYEPPDGDVYTVTISDAEPVPFATFDAAARYWARETYACTAVTPGDISVKSYAGGLCTRDGYLLHVRPNGAVYINPQLGA